MFTRVHARIPNGHEDPREENRACRTSRRGSSCVSGSDKRAALSQLTASYSCRKLNGRHADILATILAKMSCVGVHVVVGPVEFQLATTPTRTSSRGLSRECRRVVQLATGITSIARVGEDPREDVRVGIGVVEFEL